ncbi:hypothetical protein [Bradyrhizobium niftali]|uniref:hypothetical protein n=1 Tax=Bradyrhizobium niftali TaxID=2560055 RepID=UPI001F387A0A|nr:hypothetical protein [Bradyrhizobium niftali]
MDLERAKRLRYAAAARAKAVEDKTLALQRLELKGEILPRSKFAEWSQQPVDTNLRLQELNARLHRPQSERDLTGVRAPASGDLEQFSGLSPGSYVQASQTVCWISREGELVQIFTFLLKTPGLCGKARRRASRSMLSIPINGEGATRQC